MITETKVVNSRELAEIVTKMLTDPQWVEQLAVDRLYSVFGKKIIEAVTDISGGTPQGGPKYSDDSDLYEFQVAWDNQVPEDEGVWGTVDLDICWDTSED